MFFFISNGMYNALEISVIVIQYEDASGAMYLTNISWTQSINIQFCLPSHKWTAYVITYLSKVSDITQ